MSDQQKSPNTSDDVNAEEKNGVAGAHGNEGGPPTGTSGVSGTRRDPDRIKPSEDVDSK